MLQVVRVQHPVGSSRFPQPFALDYKLLGTRFRVRFLVVNESELKVGPFALCTPFPHLTRPADCSLHRLDRRSGPPLACEALGWHGGYRSRAFDLADSLPAEVFFLGKQSKPNRKNQKYTLFMLLP